MFEKFADWIVYRVLGLSPSTRFGEALHFFIYDVVKILFLLCIMISLISYIRTYINTERIRRFIEQQPKGLAYLCSALFGALTPFCSCSSLPIFIGFIEAGLPFGIAMTFLISSPMINEIAIMVLAGTIGWEITGIYIITGIIVGIVGGMLMEVLSWSKYLQDYLRQIKQHKKELPCCSSTSTVIKRQGQRERLKEAFQETIDIISKIWIFVLLGIGVGAFLHGYVPQEFFLQYMGENNPFAVPLAIIAGIPLYADATTIIPIAQVLLEKGASIGVVLVFMMSIVALSLPELIILTRVMKRELIIRFVSLMFLLFIFVGYFYSIVM